MRIPSSMSFVMPQGAAPKILLLSAGLALFLPLTACHDSSSGSSAVPDSTAPTLTPTPGSMAFTGASTTVALAAADSLDPAPRIFYTTDLSVPTTSSTLYTAPIVITATTIVKAIAVDRGGNSSPVAILGYTAAPSVIAQEWAASGHGTITNEAWRHWDEDGDVSTRCAKCHGDGGLKDYAEDGTVDAAGLIPMGLSCESCHTRFPDTIYDDLVTYPALEPVRFPSGEDASIYGKGNICATCHQGRSSAVQVDAALAANPGGPYGFINIHYYAAGATLYGSEVHGGYEYAGMEYAGRNTFPSHAPAQQDCLGCHMRGASKDHRFLPQVADCTTCHTGASFETLSGSPGSNHTAIQTSVTELLAAIRGYAFVTLGQPVAYDPGANPYFFFDLNANGVVDPSEQVRSNAYNEFDEKLLQAAYNYQVAQKDPGGFVHNGTYVRQLLHDSIVDLGATPSIPAPGRTGFDHDMATPAEQWHLSGHAHSTAEAFRHWDGDMPPEVPTSCARCHTQSGFADYVADGSVDASVKAGELVGCAACHGNLDLFSNDDTRFDDLITNAALEPVAFPSGATATLGNVSNLCMTCHQGRESGVSVDAKTPNTVVQVAGDYDSFDFINRHYFAAGAILFGADVTAAYEYAGQTYVTQNTFPGHGANLSDCFACHGRGVEDHRFEVQIDDCDGCHQGINEFEELGLPFSQVNVDYDGDGTGESFDDEIIGSATNLLAAIQVYAQGTLGSPIVYSPGDYPYFFKDSDGDGLVSPGENSYPNRYQDFDRTLLRAAFNFHCAQDPCGDIHNFRYVIQTVYDSIDDLDDSVFNGSAMGTRP